MIDLEVREFLEYNADLYNCVEFIEKDPISIPHQFEKKEDIEIIAFLISTIAWGNRQSIIKSGNKIVEIMENRPYDFIINTAQKDLNKFQFVHRTFNGEDLAFFLRSLKNIYVNHGGLELAFSKGKNQKERLGRFRETFLEVPHLKRSEKHISNPAAGSAAKRINMFLRWMVRRDKRGVDFGLWRKIPMGELLIPLDVHTSRVARSLGLLQRKTDDWASVEELTNNMRKLDKRDPCRFDFALFGAGVSGSLVTSLRLPKKF